MAQIGLKNIYFAELISDTELGTTYATPKKIGNAISVDVNPTVNKALLHGDDMVVAANISLGEIEVSFETTEVSLESKAVLLGHEYESDTLIAKSSDSAPYGALLFESTTHNGAIRCYKLFKGKFAETQETINTMGDKLEYQVPKLTGSFVSRQFDGAWKAEKDFAKGTSTASWYTDVD